MANLINNGSFVGHADDWYAETSAAIAPTFAAGTTRGVTGGSLHHPGAGRIQYRPGRAIVDLGGATTIDLVAYVKPVSGTGTAQWDVRFFSNAYGGANDNLQGPDPATATDSSVWTEVAWRDVAVPEGRTHALIRLHVSVESDVDDVYVGAVDGDAAPYAAAAAVAIPANIIGNGGFAIDAAGWEGWSGSDVVVRDATGGGNLSVTTAGGSSGQGCNSPVYPLMYPVIPAEAVRLAFTIWGAGDIEAQLFYSGAAADVVWSGTASETHVPVSMDAAVPAGATEAFVAFRTASDQAVTFHLDDVSFGLMPEASSGSLPGALLALGFGLKP